MSCLQRGVTDSAVGVDHSCITITVTLLFRWSRRRRWPRWRRRPFTSQQGRRHTIFFIARSGHADAIRSRDTAVLDIISWRAGLGAIFFGLIDDDHVTFILILTGAWRRHALLPWLPLLLLVEGCGGGHAFLLATWAVNIWWAVSRFATHSAWARHIRGHDHLELVFFTRLCAGGCRDVVDAVSILIADGRCFDAILLVERRRGGLAFGGTVTIW
mmetsp:Transcript_47195/g.117756  ORF Transcript_47195/g.117756 Transcript_47195/m.117756 type:complete len:215 (-) Transcript_47195:455-1099(-)